MTFFIQNCSEILNINMHGFFISKLIYNDFLQNDLEKIGFDVSPKYTTEKYKNQCDQNNNAEVHKSDLCNFCLICAILKNYLS